MFVGITNTPRDYAWGSAGAISTLLGTEPTGAPEAELWLGAHPGSPSRILDPSQTGGATDLAAWIAADPVRALGERSNGEPRLPFLLKVLAASGPLSLQAHPTAQQAIAGFAREEEWGIPADAPDRNYKDAFPKPEIIYALADGFEALCGFRTLDEIQGTISRLIEVDQSTIDCEPLRRWLELTRPGSELRSVFEWLISRADGVAELLDRVVEIAEAYPTEFPVVVSLANAYPGDPGIAISLMLNHVVLRRGEALYLPAGNVHAYLSGIGVELMTASDNVLRGGLTRKYVDVEELLAVLDFEPLGVPYVRPSVEHNVERLHPAGVGFQLFVVRGQGAVSYRGPAILYCESGEFDVRGSSTSQAIRSGETFYVTPDEGGLELVGAGSVFVATTT